MIGMVGNGLQICSLGFHPSSCLWISRYRGNIHKLACRCPQFDGRVSVEVVPGGFGGAQVVTKEPINSCVLIFHRIGSCQGTGVISEQVMETIAALCRLIYKVIGVECIQLLPGLVEIYATHGCCSVSVNVGAGMQTEAAEELLAINR